MEERQRQTYSEMRSLRSGYEAERVVAERRYLPFLAEKMQASVLAIGEAMRIFERAELKVGEYCPDCHEETAHNDDAHGMQCGVCYDIVLWDRAKCADCGNVFDFPDLRMIDERPEPVMVCQSCFTRRVRKIDEVA